MKVKYRITVTLMDETEDNSYVAYSAEEDLLQSMTDVYHEVVKRVGYEGEWPSTGRFDAFVGMQEDNNG